MRRPKACHSERNEESVFDLSIHDSRLAIHEINPDPHVTSFLRMTGETMEAGDWRLEAGKGGSSLVLTRKGFLCVVPPSASSVVKDPEGLEWEGRAGVSPGVFWRGSG